MTHTFDSLQFRAVLGHAPTSVVVVTGVDTDGKPHGITIGSFASVSLDPPLVGFLPGLTSRSWAAIASSGKFCVNVLAIGQDELCWRFAKEGDDKFGDIPWTASPLGNPILDGCIATIDCTVHSQTEVGDHWFVVGQAETVASNSELDGAMVFFRGKVLGVNRPE